MKFSKWFFLLAVLGIAAAWAQGGEEATDPSSPQAELGSRLFHELNFSNQAADYGSSCEGCHATGNELEGRGQRRFADYSALSMTPLKTLTARNTPTLLDAGVMPLLSWAGQYESLEALVLDKLLGAAYGWKPSDRERAIAAIQFTLLEEGTGGADHNQSYAQHFGDAYGVDLKKLEAEKVVELGARAIADYVRTLLITETAPWDAFVTQNRFHTAPNHDESAESYSFGVFSRIGNQEGRMLIKRPKGFSRTAYEGFKTFFRTEPEEEGQSVGACVLCHVPPRFTDDAFHNTGIAEAEYDALHGAMAAARLVAKLAEGEPPTEPTLATRSRPSAQQPGLIDLGRWNAAPQESGSLGAFKTPTLRDLDGTDPYMHNGVYATLADVVRAKVEISRLAREGKAQWIDPIYRRIVLTEADVEPLVAFLEQLNEVGHEHFREYLIELADD